MARMHTYSSLTALMLSGLSAPVLAQTQAPDAAAGNGIADIVVTAQRRDESLSKTPVAVTVLTAETLARAQIVSEQDLRSAAPGLSVRAGNTSNQLNFALRGQSKDLFSGVSPGVLPYINEVQIGGSGGSSAFYDLQSVQVLKGPQGTLFGRSATGGAVLFTTAKPTSDLAGYASASYGNYNALKLEGAVGGPLAGEGLMARVAGVYQRRDGFQYNLYTGGREGGFQRLGLRGSVTANLGEALHNEAVVDYLHSTGSNTVGVIAGLLPFTGSGAPYFPLEALYSGTATPAARTTGVNTLAALTRARYLPAGVTAATATPGQLAAAQTAALAAAGPFYDAYFANPHHPAGGLRSVLNAQNARGPFVIDQGGRNGYLGKNLIITNATTWSIGDETRIKNIFGYTNLRSEVELDSDGTPYTISSQGEVNAANTGYVQIFRTRQISDELQIAGKILADRLDYVAGLYYANDRNRTTQGTFFFDLLLGGSTSAYDYTITSRTYAAFAQGTYKLNDNGLAFTIGGRYTSEKAGKIVGRADRARIALGEPAPAGYSYDKSRTFDRLSWTAGLQDQVSSSLLVYAVGRRAYKSGGFNGVNVPFNGSSAVGGDSFDAQTVTSAELGVKLAGRLAGIPARINLALFNDWVRNDQRIDFIVVGGGPAGVTVNVPKGKTSGIEFDGQIKPVDWLSLGGSANYIHARYTNGAVTANGIASVYDQIPDTPEFSGTVYAELRAKLAGDLVGSLHGEVYGQTRSFTTPTSSNNVGTTMPGYALANFRFGIEDERAGWSLTANVKNAFNRIYYTGGIPLGGIYQLNLLVPGAPRTYGVEARIKF